MIKEFAAFFKSYFGNVEKEFEITPVQGQKEIFISDMSSPKQGQYIIEIKSDLSKRVKRVLKI